MEKYRAFVVEDDPDDWLFLKEAFEDVQCTDELRHYSEPATLLQELESLTAEQYPQLIVLDNKTQGLNSREVTERLRADSRYNHITIVVYTSAVAPRMAEDLQQCGADLCLAKGASSTELRHHVTRFCDLVARRTGQEP
jgi:CheY-like chemotaxis protein